MVVFEYILLTLAILIAIPVVVFLAECLLALLPSKRIHVPDDLPSPRIAILMPAHNEEAVIARTLQTLLPELKDTDRVLVVADNCTDTTATIAREAGVQVAERSHDTDRGKGFALGFGMRQLESDPPDIVIIVDADTQVTPGAIQRIALSASHLGLPVQATYFMDTPAEPSNRDLISALAFAVKNHTRPAGLARLGLPCLLTGTGMAFPWDVLSQIKLDSGNIVEDMQMGLDLAMIGKSPMMCTQSVVFGALPSQDSAATSQRTRWEHGHIQTLLTQAPRLLIAGCLRFKPSLIALGLDLFVPPLSLLVMMIMGVLLMSGLGGLLLNYWLPFTITISCFAAMVLGILVAWFVSARQIIPFSTLLKVPLYVLWKIPIYFAFLFRRQKGWVRTERDEELTKST